jgi:hypothetical protein
MFKESTTTLMAHRAMTGTVIEAFLLDGAMLRANGGTTIL